MICDLSGVCDILGLGDCSRAIRPSAWTFHCWPGSVSEHSLREMLAMSFQLAVYMVSIAVLSSVYDLGQNLLVLWRAGCSRPRCVWKKKLGKGRGITLAVFVGEYSPLGPASMHRVVSANWILVTPSLRYQCCSGLSFRVWLRLKVSVCPFSPRGWRLTYTTSVVPALTGVLPTTTNLTFTLDVMMTFL